MPPEHGTEPPPLSTLQRLGRFALAGGLGFVVDAGLLYWLAPTLGWYVARVVSFWAAATSTWLFNRRYTFADGAAVSGRAMIREYGGYLLAMLGGATLNYATYALTLAVLPPAHWVPLLGVAFGSVAGMGLNYFAAKRLIFKSTR